MLHLLALLRPIAEPTPFPAPFSTPPEIALFWGLQLSSHSMRLKRYDTSDPRGEEVFNWAIFSDLLRLNDPDTPTLFHRSSGIAFAPSSLTPGRCFRTWFQIIYQFYYLSFFFRSFTSTNVLLFSLIKKLVGITLPFTSTLAPFLQRNIRLFLFPLRPLSSLLWQ